MVNADSEGQMPHLKHSYTSVQYLETHTQKASNTFRHGYFCEKSVQVAIRDLQTPTLFVQE